jgi:cysteine-rich repeat protein
MSFAHEVHCRARHNHGRWRVAASLSTALLLAPACFNPQATGDSSGSDSSGDPPAASSDSSGTTTELPTTSGPDPSTTVDPPDTDPTTTTDDPDTTSTTAPALHESFCGDGVPDPDLNEVCDDGNFFNDDECTNFCEEPRCGDGFVGPQEVCDDGNFASGDGCSMTCTCERESCGDGRRDADEECDDGNTSDRDACSSCCERRYDLAFVSSKQFVGGKLGAFDKADEACTALAGAAGLSGNFRAWLAGDRGVATPFDSVFDQPYGLPGTGEIVANSWEQLRDGPLVTAIHVTEKSEDLGPPPDDPCSDPARRVWTGTESDGTGVWNATCANWTLLDPVGRFGAVGSTGPTWASCEMEAPCDTMARLYCFEVQP